MATKYFKDDQKIIEEYAEKNGITFEQAEYEAECRGMVFIEDSLKEDVEDRFMERGY